MKIKVLSHLYDPPQGNLTLGEQRIIKREFGVVPTDDLDVTDPDHLGAFLYATFRQADANATSASILKAIDGVKEMEFVNDDGTPFTGDDEQDDAEGKADPTPAPKSAGKKTGS